MIIIDAGHGGADPGANGHGVTEKDWTLEVSLHQYHFLRKLGIQCKVTRDRDVQLPPERRAALVKQSGAKVCISNHYNAGGGSGAEVIQSIYSKSKLAKQAADALMEAGMPVRRVFSRKGEAGDYYYMHRLTGSVETIIVEYGFLDSAVDMKKLSIRSFRLQLAEEAALAAVKYSRGVENSLYVVQSGAYYAKDKAEKLCEELKQKGYEAFVRKTN
ncbi:N-acetylmuramoyl-L-alanine amidase [Guptibacillus hwajinpoensis]|uniref:N-acetylmuramoyl-L-alanine amidase n=1 Tax=Guptibacillus hwajinpoensis TaxID=208199 RepID=UPI003735E48B